MTSTTLPPRTGSLLNRLAREWEVMAVRPAVLRRAAGWELGVPFRSLDDLVAAAGLRPAPGATRLERSSPGLATHTSACPTDPERVLASLLRTARHDDVAARVVLQRLLPGLVAAARRWQRRCEHADAVGELLAAVWPVIRTFPVELHSSFLAARLLRAAEYHAFIRPRRRAVVPDPVAPDTFEREAFGVDSPAVASDPRAELEEIVAVARRTVLSEHDIHLLELVLSGRPTIEMAAALAMSERSVRNHRDALVSRLRQTARALAAA